MRHIRIQGPRHSRLVARVAGATVLAVAAAGTATSASLAQEHHPLQPGKVFPQAPITPEHQVRTVQRFASPTLVPKYDVPTFGYGNSRAGADNAEKVLGTATVGGLRQLWATPFADNPGAMDATPVGLSNVPTKNGTQDLIYVGNEHGAFGAIDANTGTVVWEKSVGYRHTTCGDFPNGDAGVTGSAVIDRPANRVYVAGGDGRLYAFDLAGGTVPGWTPPVITSRPLLNHVYGALTLDRAHHQVYATLASFCDHTPYQGQLVGVNTTTGAVRRWTVIKNKQNGGGIWGWGGASVDPQGNPFVATGNALPNGRREATPYAEYVVKLRWSNFAVLGAHHPALKGGDVDFGATPTLFTAPRCPAGRLAVENKDGYLFIYRRNHLRNGPVEKLPLAAGRARHYFIGLPAWDGKTGTLFVSNPDGGPGYPHGMAALRFSGNAKVGCKTHKLWATAAGPAASPVSSPVLANGVVYYADGIGDTLHAFDARTGKQLWQSAQGDFTGPVFSAPLVINGRLYATSRGGALHAFG